jgi:hypothetical protein
MGAAESQAAAELPGEREQMVMIPVELQAIGHESRCCY